MTNRPTSIIKQLQATGVVMPSGAKELLDYIADLEMHVDTLQRAAGGPATRELLPRRTYYAPGHDKALERR